MTEDEWLAGTDPGRMLPFLHHRLSARKLRLLGVACCRAIWPLLPDRVGRAAVTTAERYADREVSLTALKRASSTAREAHYRVPRVNLESLLEWPPPDIARLAGWGNEEFARSRNELLGMALWFVSIVAGPDLANRRVFPEHPFLPHRRFVSPFIIWDAVGNPFRATPTRPRMAHV